MCGTARGAAALRAAAASPPRAPPAAPAEPPPLPLQAAAPAALPLSSEGALSADLARLRKVSSWHAERAARLLASGVDAGVLREVCGLPGAAARDARMLLEEDRLALPPLKRVFCCP